jgi:dihydrofolate reductase
MKISLIVAMSSNRAIGVDGKMPWHLPADLKRFRQITLGHPVIMGRKTFEAIGKPLPGRQNIIISRNAAYQQPGCQVFADIPSCLAACAGCEEIFVIGGASLYQAFLDQAKLLYLTEICQVFAGDTFFPQINLSHWQEVERLEVEDDGSVGFRYRFLTYQRVQN